MATSEMFIRKSAKPTRGCTVSTTEGLTVLLVTKISSDSVLFTGVVVHSDVHNIGDTYEDLPLKNYPLFTGSVTLTQD